MDLREGKKAKKTQRGGSTKENEVNAEQMPKIRMRMMHEKEA